MKFSTKIVAIMAILSALTFCSMQVSLAGDAKDSLTYINHSFVKIKTADGVIIYIDPYAVNAFADSADIVLITHEHGDHNDTTRVKRKTNCVTIRSKDCNIGGTIYKSYTIGSVKIMAVPAYNNNHPKASCVGYVVEFNGVKLYHAGDTGNIPEMADLDTLDLDYALVPMEGTYTVTPEVATQMAAKINAKHDMPIHTMVPPDIYSDAAVAKFTSPNKLVVHPGETIALEHTVTNVKSESSTPFRFELKQNFPNPFNPSTEIEFSIVQRGQATLKIFDILGKVLAELVDENLNPGNYRVQWNAKSCSSGIYFYRLQSSEFSQTKKMVLVK